MRTVTVADILHVQDIVCVILDRLSAADILSAARASTAFQSAIRPRSLELSIIRGSRRGRDLRVLQSLQSLGSLQHLQQVTTQVDDGSLAFKAAALRSRPLFKF